MKKKKIHIPFVILMVAVLIVSFFISARAATTASYDIALQDWVYTQQGNGDESEATNCGPASVAMVVKAVKGREFENLRPEEVRYLASISKYTYTNATQLQHALSAFGIQSQILTSFSELEKAIVERHHLVIALALMGKLSDEGNLDDYYEEWSWGCPEPGRCNQTLDPNPLTANYRKYVVWNGNKQSIFTSGRYNPYKGLHWLVAYSGGWRPVIPVHVDHPIRWMPVTG